MPLLYRFNAWRNWRKWRLATRGKARPDPFLVAYVKPESIERISGSRFSYGDMRRSSGLIADGDWDVNGGDFWTSAVWDPSWNATVPEAFLLHFRDQVPWEETPFFSQRYREADEGTLDWHRCRTRTDLNERCKRLEMLFESIRDNGYRSRRDAALDLLRRKPKRNPGRFEYEMDEVVVNVGRFGELLFVGGQHRLSIAKLLEVPKIPVRIFVRHSLWQTLRERVARYGPAELQGTDISIRHPDLHDCLNLWETSIKKQA